MDRAELQRLARDRLRDARTLLSGGRWAAAYYLAGYAVECGLKACIIGYLMKTDQFPDKRFSEQCWTHNLVQLIRVANMELPLDAEIAADPEFDKAWRTVKDWRETSRYERKTKSEAVKLYKAITDKKHGVLRWIRSYW